MTNKKTRSNSYYGEVLDLGKAKRTNGLTLNPTASPYEKRLYYSKVFMDPPSRGITRTRRSTSEVNQGGSAAASTDGPTSARFRLLQFNAACTNCDGIFRAVMFLRDRLPEKAHLRDPNYRFNLSKDSAAVKELATELGSAEPLLLGVTATALYSVYERIVRERRSLDAWLKVATDEPWRDTRLAEMALDLVHTEDQIRERERRQWAQKDEEKSRDLAEEEATSGRTLRAMLGNRDDWSEANEDRTDIDTAEEILEKNLEEEVARAPNATDLSLDSGLVSQSSASTVDTASQSTSAAILSGAHATINFSQPSDSPSHAQSNELFVIRPPLDTSQSTGLIQPKRPFGTPGPNRKERSTSASTDTDPPSSSPFGSSSTTFHQPAKRVKRAIAPDSDKIALLTGRVEELEERNQYLTARINHLTQLSTIHRTWLEEERLPKLTDRMTDKLMQLIDGQNVLFKNQMDQVTAQMTSHLFQLTSQLNAQGSQLNAQLYAQGSQLTQLKTQTSQLNIEISDIQRESRKLIATMESTSWESPPLRTGVRSSFQSRVMQ
ncbi:hypothetical protein BG015_005142 [Linnemannia schmuckeri]|uniref:Uncharacterized protein n=1 Tax=Linnemannia schmuckeri TaxID=64567 RepID=A0A9P5UX89_9FUNG|nr:hypothetical protein BG015_005142 [Linnemannia schmuckeri]